MNSHERSFTPATTAVTAASMPASTGSGGRSRRRWIAVIVAAVLLAGAALATFWYFQRCGNCGGGPILCPDPCTLPIFS
jgi:hypothetical protein